MEERPNKISIIIAVIVAGGLIVWGILATHRQENLPTEESSALANIERTKDLITTTPITLQATDYFLGNPEAKIVFISFSDFGCSFCKEFHQTLRQIIDVYGKEGQVAWASRQFPIYGAVSENKAIAVRCAGQIGGTDKFWEMSDRIFQTEFSTQEEFVTEQLIELSTVIDLEKDAFLTCLKSETILNILEQEYQSGIAANIFGTASSEGGTPYTIILTNTGKTYPINGAQPYPVIEAIVNLLLKD